MTIYKSAYDTIINKTTPLDKIRSNLLLASGSDIVEIKPGVVMVVGDVPTLPSFIHPVTNNDITYLDARGILKLDPITGKLKVNSHKDDAFNRLRAVLQHAWENKPESFKPYIGYTGSVLVDVLSTQITRKTGLEGSVRLPLEVFIAYYYLSLFRDTSKKLSDDDVVEMAKQMEHILRIPVIDILNILEAAFETVTDMAGPFESNIDTLAKWINEGIQSTRAKTINKALIYTLFQNTYFINNGPNVMSTALQHPPTWVAVCALAVDTPSDKRTVIGDAVHNKRRYTKDGFEASMKLLMKN